jgi:hypothetical protein
MEEQNKRIIEINGIKMEVDLRTAKRIDTFKVGDPVKVLDMSYSTPQIRAGVIVGFAEFQSLPAIEVMVLTEDYSGVGFAFKTITQKKEGEKIEYEIVLYNNYEKIFTRSNVISRFDREIDKKKIEIEELELKKKYFINDFQKAFEQML